MTTSMIFRDTKDRKPWLAKPLHVRLSYSILGEHPSCFSFSLVIPYELLGWFEVESVCGWLVLFGRRRAAKEDIHP